MYRFPIFVLSILIFYLISCSEDGTGPKPKPPGYQEDIPWPSLADTPWPIFHGDAQSTGRSPFAGPVEGIVLQKLEAPNSQAGVIVGFDSTFYFTWKYGLIASDFSGNKKWDILIGRELTTTPLISNDSVIFTANGALRTIYAINLDGEIRWEYKASASIWDLTLGIDLAGNIYFVDFGKDLNALSKDGELLWQLHDERFLAGQDVTLSFSPDGNTLYLQGIDVSLLAIDIDQKSVKWVFGEKKLKTGPVIDSQGNIYIFPDADSESDNYFYSLKPTGEIRWQFKHEEKYQYVNIEPSIDRNGNIFFGGDTL